MSATWSIAIGIFAALAFTPLITRALARVFPARGGDFLEKAGGAVEETTAHAVDEDTRRRAQYRAAPPRELKPAALDRAGDLHGPNGEPRKV